MGRAAPGLPCVTRAPGSAHSLRSLQSALSEYSRCFDANAGMDYGGQPAIPGQQYVTSQPNGRRDMDSVIRVDIKFSTETIRMLCNVPIYINEVEVIMLKESEDCFVLSGVERGGASESVNFCYR